MKKLLFVLAAAVLLLLTACGDGSFVDPGMMDSLGYDGDGDGGGFGGGGSVGNLSGTKWVCNETVSSGGVSTSYTITLTFTSASRVTMETSLKAYGYSSTVEKYDGTYTVSGSYISVKWDAGYSGSGSFTANGNKLTSGDGHVFTKQ